MIKSKFIDLLKLRLGSREDSDMDALIVAEAGQVQIELEEGQFQPWFLYAEDTIATIASARTVDLPATFIAFNPEDTEYAVSYLTAEGNYQPIIAEDRGRLENYYGIDEGTPTHFVVDVEMLSIYPIPDAVYTLRLFGFFSDENFDVLDLGEENKWLKNAGDWLLAKTGARIARYIKDKDAAAAFAADEQLAFNRVYTRHVAWMESVQSRTMGGL
jgi:hypothetical protein